MRLPRAPLVLLAFLGAGVPLLPASFVAPPALAVDAIDELLLKFDELLKGDDEGKTLAMIVELEGKPDARVTAKLAEVAKSHKSDRVAIAAMAQAASRKSPDLLKWLKGKIEFDKWAEKHPDRHKAVLRSLARYGDKSALKPLEDAVKDAVTKQDAELVALAIAAYGSVREKPVVDQLLKWLVEAEQTGAGQGRTNPSKETLATRGAEKAAVLKALEDLTLQAIGDAKTWQEWWDQNRKTFEFPDPNAPEVDVTTLTEFVDKAYGWSIKRSQDKGWTFVKADFEGGRVRLVFRDENGFDWARIDAITWKATKDAPHVEALANLWVKRWNEGEFDKPYAKGGDPVVEQKKFGGKEFWVASARGMAAGSWKSWEGCERRLYGHQLNPNLLLYFECAVRFGAEEPVKKALWATIEGITFKR